MTEYRTGRLVNHDPKSRAYHAARATTHRPVIHKIYGVVLDQGNLSSCVGNAATHALNAQGYKKWYEWPYNEKFAVSIYGDATHLDPFPGEYPPEDTGTDANSLCKVLRARGKIRGWAHCWDLDHIVGAVQLAPVMVGFEFDEGCASPDPTGVVHPGGRSLGGHETLIYADDAKGYFWVRNSWGSDWGRHGDYLIAYEDLWAKLSQAGDATTLVR